MGSATLAHFNDKYYWGKTTKRMKIHSFYNQKSALTDDDRCAALIHSHISSEHSDMKWNFVGQENQEKMMSFQEFSRSLGRLLSKNISNLRLKKAQTCVCGSVVENSPQ